MGRVLNDRLVDAETAIESGTGGGGSTGITFKARTLTPTTYAVAFGQKSTISFDWSSYDNDDKEDTGSGTMLLKVAGRTRISTGIEQGVVTTDITSFLVAGVNDVIIEIIDSYSNKRIIAYTVTAVSLIITSTYRIETLNYDAIVFSFIPMGTGIKTVHFELDGDELPVKLVSSSGEQESYTIPKQPHGSKGLRVDVGRYRRYVDNK